MALDRTMRRRFDLLVFDWDGTLADSAAHIVGSIQGAFHDLSLPVPDEMRARHVIGLGLADALAYLLPALPREHYSSVAERYRHHYIAREQNVRLFAGAREGLERLRAAGFLLGVATGKSRAGLDRAIEWTGLREVFHATRCADEGRPKPDPEMLVRLMEALGIGRERTLMIGDTAHDLEMARDAGVAGLAVAYGAHEQSKLNALSPVGCMASFGELMEWLDANA
jgi:phosphoglycolate phosphatase